MRQKGDLTSIQRNAATQLAAALQTCVDAFGGLDILFNNAGAGGTPCTLEDFDPDGFDRTVALLLKSVMTGTHLAVPHFKARGGGSVINTSSITALNPGYGPMVYSVCKAGVAHFTKLAAAELSKYNIRVNAILPGFIATGIFGTAMGQSPDDADRLAAVLSQGMARNQPLGRGGVGTDVAEMAAFLASDAASFITGAGMTVDGGLTLGPRHAWDPSAPDPISAALAASPELAAQMHQLFSPADSKA